jgi:hypothetical protein
MMVAAVISLEKRFHAFVVNKVKALQAGPSCEGVGCGHDLAGRDNHLVIAFGNGLEQFDIVGIAFGCAVLVPENHAAVFEVVDELLVEDDFLVTAPGYKLGDVPARSGWVAVIARKGIRQVDVAVALTGKRLAYRALFQGKENDGGSKDESETHPDQPEQIPFLARRDRFGVRVFVHTGQEREGSNSSVPSVWVMAEATSGRVK